MASLSSYAQNLVLDSLMRGRALVPPTLWYIALVTTTGASNFLAGLEVQGGSYTRAIVPASLAAWAGTQGQGSTGISIGASAASSNNALIRFPDPSANWGSIVGYEFWDAMVNGNRWLYDNLIVPKTVSVGDPAVGFPPGQLQVSFV